MELSAASPQFSLWDEFKDVFSLIRFPLISPSDMADVVRPQNLLPDDVYADLLTYLCSSTKDYDILIRGFSCRPRRKVQNARGYVLIGESEEVPIKIEDNSEEEEMDLGGNGMEVLEIEDVVKVEDILDIQEEKEEHLEEETMDPPEPGPSNDEEEESAPLLSFHHQCPNHEPLPEPIVASSWLDFLAGVMEHAEDRCIVGVITGNPLTPNFVPSPSTKILMPNLTRVILEINLPLDQIPSQKDSDLEQFAKFRRFLPDFQLEPFIFWSKPKPEDSSCNSCKDEDTFMGSKRWPNLQPFLDNSNPNRKPILEFLLVIQGVNMFSLDRIHGKLVLSRGMLPRFFPILQEFKEVVLLDIQFPSKLCLPQSRWRVANVLSHLTLWAVRNAFPSRLKEFLSNFKEIQFLALGRDWPEPERDEDEEIQINVLKDLGSFKELKSLSLLNEKGLCPVQGERWERLVQICLLKCTLSQGMLEEFHNLFPNLVQVMISECCSFKGNSTGSEDPLPVTFLNTILKITTITGIHLGNVSTEEDPEKVDEMKKVLDFLKSVGVSERRLRRNPCVSLTLKKVKDSAMNAPGNQWKGCVNEPCGAMFIEVFHAFQFMNIFRDIFTFKALY